MITVRITPKLFINQMSCLICKDFTDHFVKFKNVYIHGVFINTECRVCNEIRNRSISIGDWNKLVPENDGQIDLFTDRHDKRTTIKDER